MTDKNPVDDLLEILNTYDHSQDTSSTSTSSTTEQEKVEVEEQNVNVDLEVETVITEEKVNENQDFSEEQSQTEEPTKESSVDEPELDDSKDNSQDELEVEEDKDKSAYDLGNEDFSNVPSPNLNFDTTNTDPSQFNSYLNYTTKGVQHLTKGSLRAINNVFNGIFDISKDHVIGVFFAAFYTSFLDSLKRNDKSGKDQPYTFKDFKKHVNEKNKNSLKDINEGIHKVIELHSKNSKFDEESKKFLVNAIKTYNRICGCDLSLKNPEKVKEYLDFVLENQIGNLIKHKDKFLSDDPALAWNKGIFDTFDNYLTREQSIHKSSVEREEERSQEKSEEKATEKEYTRS